MPGDSTIGDYTAAELAEMPRADFLAAEARGFRRPNLVGGYPYVLDESHNEVGPKERPAAAGVPAGFPAPPLEAQPEPADDVWIRNRTEKGQDFTCPSGQRCQIQKLSPEALLAEGILDQVTRLEGLAQDLVDRAEGKPPQPDRLPSREDFEALLHVINVITPLAVLQPKVFRDDDPTAGPSAVRISDIELTDRIAIMNESLKGIKMLDGFRNAR